VPPNKSIKFVAALSGLHGTRLRAPLIFGVEAVEKTQVRLILVALSKQTRSRRNASFQALQLRSRFDGGHQPLRAAPAARSSSACETNIIFKALSCDTVPHFTTLARFVSQHADEIEELFEQVRLVFHEQGLLSNELFAIDGCKMSSDAAKEWSGTFKELSEKRDKLKRLIRHHLHRHHKRDEAETQSPSIGHHWRRTI
jgi:hypothetical protein